MLSIRSLISSIMRTEQPPTGPLVWRGAPGRPPIGPVPQPDAARKSTAPPRPLGPAFTLTISPGEFPAEISSGEPAAPVHLRGLVPALGSPRERWPQNHGLTDSAPGYLPSQPPGPRRPHLPSPPIRANACAIPGGQIPGAVPPWPRPESHLLPSGRPRPPLPCARPRCSSCAHWRI